MRSLSALLCLLLTARTAAFLPSGQARLVSQRHLPPAMGIFDALSGAFANDDTLGARENAGLSK